MTAANIAAAALGVGVDAVVAVEPIKHGLTNETWRVQTRADTVVVRIANRDPGALQIDRRSEAAILAAVAQAGIGPEVLLCEPDSGTLVTRYLGEPWTEEAATRDENIVRIAELLRRLHRLAAPEGAHRVELGVTIEGYFRTLDERGRAPELMAKSLRERALQVAAKLRENSAATLCHNDVHHLNIIEANGPRLVDWEYAGVGQRLFDLASVCVYHRYDKRQREQLLATYASLIDVTNWHRLELACWLFEYVRDLWMAVREASAA